MAYFRHQLLEGQASFQLPLLRLDRKGETLEELIAVTIKRHLARLHQSASTQVAVYHSNVILQYCDRLVLRGV